MVSAAGTTADGALESRSAEAWDEMMEVDLRSLYWLSQRVLPVLAESRGNMVNVSSVWALRTFRGILACCVNKAALDQSTCCAALKLASRRVGVSAVKP